MITKNRTRGVIGGIAAAAALAMFVPAGAAATPKTGVGTVKCASLTGTLKFAPALRNGGTSSEKITISTTDATCSGTMDGATILRGATTGSLTAPTNDCQSLLGTHHYVLTTATQWTVKTGKPALKASNVKFTTETGNAGNGGTIPITFDAAGKDIGGSFLNKTATAHAVIRETVTQLATACGGTGITVLHINAGTVSLH